MPTHQQMAMCGMLSIAGSIRIPAYAKQFPDLAPKPAPNPPDGDSQPNGSSDTNTGGGETASASLAALAASAAADALKTALMLSQDVTAGLARHSRARSTFEALALSAEQLERLPFLEPPTPATAARAATAATAATALLAGEAGGDKGRAGQVATNPLLSKLKPRPRWPQLSDDSVPYLLLPVRPLNSASELLTRSCSPGAAAIAAAAAATGWEAMVPGEIEALMARADRRKVGSGGGGENGGGSGDSSGVEGCGNGGGGGSSTKSGSSQGALDTFGLTSTPHASSALAPTRTSAGQSGRGRGRGRGGNVVSRQQKQMSMWEGLWKMKQAPTRPCPQTPPPQCAPSPASSPQPPTPQHPDQGVDGSLANTPPMAAPTPAGTGGSCDASNTEGEAAMQLDGEEEEDEEAVYGVLLLPVRSTLMGAFPLNATYFQTNEVFVDALTSHSPLRIPLSLLRGGRAVAGRPVPGSTAPKPEAQGSNLRWRTIYFGLSTASIVR